MLMALMGLMAVKKIHTFHGFQVFAGSSGFLECDRYCWLVSMVMMAIVDLMVSIV